MRSLWKTIAARWLGGEGSPGLAGEAPLRDLLPAADEIPQPGFLVRRRSEVSHRAIMTQPAGPPGEGVAAGAPAEPRQSRR